jgi:hypothetical protein
LRLVKITLNTPTPLADLLDHLRERGCIAYLDEEGRCIHVVPEDEAELTELLDAWAAEAGVTYALRD